MSWGIKKLNDSSIVKRTLLSKLKLTGTGSIWLKTWEDKLIMNQVYLDCKKGICKLG